MKKKLLTFIISIFLAVGCFTNTVYADISTVYDLFEEYGAEYLYSSSKKFSNGSAIFYFQEDAGNTYYATFGSSLDSEYDYLEDYLHQISVTQTSNNVYEGTSNSVALTEPLSLKFTIDGDKISNIVVSGFTDSAYTLLNGTYTPVLTIADILDTADGGFPVSIDDGTTFPDDCWYSSSGMRLFCDNNMSILKVDETLDLPVNSTVTKDSDGNYISTVQVYIFENIDVNLKFFMDNNKLVKVFIDAPFFGLSFNFEPLGNRKTLGSLFSDLGDKKPNSSTNSWVNENNMHLYIGSDNFLHISELEASSNDSIYSSLACLRPSTDYSKYEDDVLLLGFYQSHITAFIENSKIKRLKIDFEDSVIDNTGYDADIKQLIKKVKGTYSAPVTVADIMPSDFPDSAGTSWTNGVGTLYLTGGEIKLDGSQSVLTLNTVVNKDVNNNYYVFNTALNSTITFNMKNGTFSSITVSGLTGGLAPYNGTYSAPVRVSTVLPSTFPNSHDAGYVNNSGKRAYIDSSNLKVGSNIIGVTNILVKEGNNYSYTNPSGVKFLFNMSNGVASSITVSGSTTTSENGTYEVYRFMHNPINKPIGYKGDIEFKTNATYLDAQIDSIVVKVDGTQINSSSRGTFYNVEHGSTIITLLGDYVKDLTGTSHTISITVPGYIELTQTFTFSNTPSGGGGSSGYSIPNTGVK